MARRRVNDDLRDKVEDIRVELAGLKACSERHEETTKLIQDTLKGMMVEQQKTNERMAEYNAQLAVHIAATNELKQQTKSITEHQKSFEVVSNKRLDSLETPYKVIRALSKASGVMLNVLKVVAVITLASSSVYGGWRVVAEYLLK